MSINKRKTTNSKTKTTKSIKTTSSKVAAKKPARTAASKAGRLSPRQLAMHKRRFAVISGILLCLGALCFVVFFILFWIFFHTCDYTITSCLSKLEIIFILPLFVNILSLICALDCKHPLHSRTVILNILMIAIETVFIAFVPLYLLVLR